MATKSPSSPPLPAVVSNNVALTTGFARVGAAARRLHGTVLATVGDTPLVDLSAWARRYGVPAHVRLLAKLEGFNPGGSVKDRPALMMVLDGIERGVFDPTQRILLDSTSGNTGIAYALIGAALNFRVTLCIPANASSERLQVLKAYGAELVLTDPLEGSDGAIVVSDRILHQDPERYWKPDQYNNPANPQAHAWTTAPEIWWQTQGSVTHILATLGTSGTAIGIKRGMGDIAPHVRVLSVEPDNAFHGIEGLKHMASSIVPGIYAPHELDGNLPVATEDAYATAIALARETGLLTGPSGGAALAAAIAWSRQIGHGTLVAVLPDGGTRYLSTQVWRDLVATHPERQSA